MKEQNVNNGLGGIVFTVPGEPVGKGRPRFVKKTGVAFTPERTRSYEAMIRYSAREAMRGLPLFLGPMRLVVTAYFAMPKKFTRAQREASICGALVPTKRPDGDNLLKGVADALNTVVVRDDAQFATMIVTKLYSDKPRVTVSVQPLSQDFARAA